MSIKNIIEYKDNLDKRKISILETALLKINDDYFQRENNMYFLLDLFDENISFDITLEDLEESKIYEIVDNLKCLGYKVDYIIEDIVIFKIILNEVCSDKLIPIYIKI